MSSFNPTPQHSTKVTLVSFFVPYKCEIYLGKATLTLPISVSVLLLGVCSRRSLEETKNKPCSLVRQFLEPAVCWMLSPEPPSLCHLGVDSCGTSEGDGNLAMVQQYLAELLGYII